MAAQGIIDNLKQWVNFHNHTTSSLLDGLSKPKPYCERAIKLGQPAVAATEHGNVHGLLAMYNAAKDLNIPFFPGQEFYQARKTRFDTDPDEMSGKSRNEWDQRGPYHLGVIAYNNVGYHNLIKLSSKAYLEGFLANKPRIDHELLSQHSEGIVVLSGCLSGEVQQALLRGDYEFALKTAKTMQDIVGKDNYFIEIHNHGITEELQTHAGLIEIAKTIGAPIIATCDSHYTLKEHHHNHDILLCTNTKSLLTTEGRFKFAGPEFYLKSYEEMARLFPEEYVSNSMLIYDKYDLHLSFDEHHIPQFPTPKGKSTDEYFTEWVYKGAAQRFGDNWRANKVILERIEYELDVIREMEFPNYFLIVADICNYAHENKIMIGAGRGSAAGCLVAYCMRITEVDPIKYELPFERFLIPGRKSLPDIDLDFDDRYREQVMEYTRNKYGYDHCAQIGTISKIGAKTAIRDVARVLNHPFSFSDEINKTMPPALFGRTKSLEECLASDEFRKLYDSREEVKEVVDTAQMFEGMWRQTGVHAAGLVIADKPIIEYIPVLQKTVKGVLQPVATQWDLNEVEKCGLLKIDFLGLRNISMEDIAFDNIKKRKGIEFEDRYKLVEEQDPEVYESLSSGQNVGVFQLESNGLLNLMIGLKPSGLNDIAALLALYRPGPMASNLHNEYVERKHGRKATTFLHPSLEPFLKPTYGLLIYQEQVLSIARFVAGFNVPDSDALRKAIGKKVPAEMKAWRDRFINGCVSTSNMPYASAEKLFNEIEHHADYSFSKNHAVAYGFTSYLTAWLKTKYPIEFMAGALTSLGSATISKDKIKLYLTECKKLGINVLPPSITHRNLDFSIVDDNTIRYSFEAVKGFGDKTLELMSKDTQKYGSTLFAFLREADNAYLDRGTIESLINAGCLDDFLSTMEIPQPELKRNERLEVLARELQTLGVFLTDHPILAVQDLLAGKTTYSLMDLQSMMGREKVKIAGVVVDAEKKITRAGKRMYNLRIEDNETDIEVIVMPNIASDLGEDPFKVGDIIVVTGKTKKDGDDEKTSIQVIMFEHEKIETDLLNGGSPIFISAKKQLTFEQIKRINDIIESAKGNSPVFLKYLDNGSEVQIKFKSTSSKDIEETLNRLLEV